MRTDIANVTEPTFAELAQLADALWNEQRYSAAARIFLQAAAVARKQRLYASETTALLFALKLQDEAAKAA
jgi:ribosomal protein L7/L12